MTWKNLKIRPLALRLHSRTDVNTVIMSEADPLGHSILGIPFSVREVPQMDESSNRQGKRNWIKWQHDYCNARGRTQTRIRSRSRKWRTA